MTQIFTVKNHIKFSFLGLIVDDIITRDILIFSFIQISFVISLNSLTICNINCKPFLCEIGHYVNISISRKPFVGNLNLQTFKIIRPSEMNAVLVTRNKGNCPISVGILENQPFNMLKVSTINILFEIKKSLWV